MSNFFFKRIEKAYKNNIADDRINENLAKLATARVKIPKKKYKLISFFFNLENSSFKKINMSNADIENSNCGLGELAKTKVMGHANINTRNNLNCFFLKKIGIKASKEENCIIPPNCSALITNPIDISISPNDAKFKCIGNISL